ncbi:MAG: thioredoxin [Flavobacteriales bacterium]|nr:MAG: thioredoxin [Flavobacteriales bacterium]
MKKIIYLLTLSIIACATNEKYLINEGEVDVDYLFNSPNTSWFQKNYESYIVDGVTQNEDFSKLNEYNIEIFMNTKCHDSEREVPRFLKILNTLNFSNENLRIVLLNSEKKTIDGLEIGKDITNTPTIIFLKNSKEENRIVEFPYENLENDIFRIINDMGYKNVYFSE